MHVDKIARHEKKADRFAVKFDDGSEINVSAAQIADFGLYSGRVISEDEYKELNSAIELNSAKTSALRILGNRSISTHDLEKRLVSKGNSGDAAQQTVEWLEQVGIVNDEELAASIVKQYSKKGYGPAKIKDELYRRGIPREMIDEAMSSLDENDEAAVEYIVKKLKGSRDKDDLQNITKALYRRGFSYETARDVVRQYLELIDETEGID